MRIQKLAWVFATIVILIGGMATARAQCTPTEFVQDGNYLTAAQINPTGTFTATVDATGCNIGVYYNTADSGGAVSGATISGANYYGVLVNGRSINITTSSIHDIGESPFNGAQHGVGIYYTGGATGSVTGNTVFNYQKNGISVSGTSAVIVSGNTVTGQGPVNYIAQNGVEIIYGATASVKNNSINNNYYTGSTWEACGLLFYEAGGVSQSKNTFSGNQKNVCNAGRGGGGNKP